jgi:hypothetical protein
MDGSTLAARRAGMWHAMRATPASLAATAANVIGFDGSMPNTPVFNRRLATKAPLKPRARPHAVIIIPWRTTSATRLAALAPNAARITVLGGLGGLGELGGKGGKRRTMITGRIDRLLTEDS